MTPDDYRYYRLDGLGHIEGAEWLDATSDQDAIAQLKTKHSEETCELWKGRRLVGRISPDPSDTPLPSPVQE